MNTILLKGKPVSDALYSQLESRVGNLIADGIIPQLAAILIIPSSSFAETVLHLSYTNRYQH